MATSKLNSLTVALSLGLMALFGAISSAFWGKAMALGVLLGGTLMIGNLYLLRWSLSWTLVPGPPDQGTRRFLAVFILKFAVFAAVFALAVWSGKIHPLGLFLGCSVVVGAVLILAPIVGITGLVEEEEHGGRRN